jgi:hypothetical protein
MALKFSPDYAEIFLFLLVYIFRCMHGLSQPFAYFECCWKQDGLDMEKHRGVWYLEDFYRNLNVTSPTLTKKHYIV